MGVLLLDHGELIDRHWKRFKSKNWWIAILPEHQIETSEYIENKFYTPKTERNAGFELVYLQQYYCYLLAMDKRYMSKGDFENVIGVSLGNADFGRLDIFDEEETYKHIKNIEAATENLAYSDINYEVKSNNIDVIHEIQIFYGMVKLQRELFDYFNKQLNKE